jgi:hypothetical protein
MLIRHHLGLFRELRNSFKTTNCIDSLKVFVCRKTNKVDEWRKVIVGQTARGPAKF